MKILPPTTDLPTAPLARRHAPRPGQYTSYRACLRWEFGFTCAFCWLHESDFVVHGIEGSGLTSIEHFVPRSAKPELLDVYDNCFYACRYCNGARRAAPNNSVDGAALLNPCASAWASYFTWLDLNLKPLSRDAAYTATTYDINDPRKVELRSRRRETIAGAWDTLERNPALVERLHAAAARTFDLADRNAMLGAAERLAKDYRTAHHELQRFGVVPRDADTSCRCHDQASDCLPAYLEQQGTHLHDMGVQ